MSSDATDNTMRAEFEAWAASEKMNLTLYRDLRPVFADAALMEGIHYANAHTDDAWHCWQAARADTASMVAKAAPGSKEE